MPSESSRAWTCPVPDMPQGPLQCNTDNVEDVEVKIKDFPSKPLMLRPGTHR